MAPQHHRSRNGQNGDDVQSPSNEKLLCTAFISFQCFAIAQTIAAVIAGSEAMLGDSAAMMVDAFTYLFNWFAERQKDFYAKKLKQQEQLSDGHSSPSLRSLEYRKYTYQLELVPPLLSVSTLLVVTGFVLKSAIKVLILDSKRDVSEQSDPNVNLMMLFSFLNLLLDVVNVGCFATAKHALGYKTTNDDEKASDIRNEEVKSFHDNENDDFAIEMTEQNGNAKGGEVKSNGEEGGEESLDEDAEDDLDEVDETMAFKARGSDHQSAHEESSNLNMCSAYTHVFADTLRSLAVIFASLLAKFTDSVTSEVADSVAAVVVSILIVLSLVPLFGGMLQTFRALNQVNNQLEVEWKSHLTQSEEDEDYESEGSELSDEGSVEVA